MIEPEMCEHLADTEDVFFLQPFFGIQARVRIYLKVAPQTAKSPYCVLFKVSPGKDYTHSGSGLSMSRMQVSCFADTYREVKQTANLIKTRMENWPAAESSVQAVFKAAELDLFEERTYHIALDFFVWHTY